MGWPPFLAAALAAVVATATSVAASRRHRRRARPGHRGAEHPGPHEVGDRAPGAGPPVGPDDVAEVDAMFATVFTDDRRHRDDVLVAHLLPLVRRQVPIRRVEPLPRLGLTRIRFADGTAVVARGTTPGDLGVLATVVGDRSVRASACVASPAGTHLVLSWDRRPRGLTVVVTGLDQPD